MLIDFLCNTRPIFSEELNDFDELRAELNTDSAFVGFMPAITLDLWPIYALGCTHASRFTGSNVLPKVYFMPISVSDRAIYPSLCEFIRKYYAETEDTAKEPEKKSFFERLAQIFSGSSESSELREDDSLYGISVEEIILLDSPAIGGDSPLHISSGCECNAVYFRLSLPNKSSAHLFAVCNSPDRAWIDIIERYGIRTGMIIHSHKGFGHWFTLTPLYAHLKSTKMPHLLPHFYFRGKFITNDDSPPASEELETVQDDILGGGCIIYRLPDKLQ